MMRTEKYFRGIRKYSMYEIKQFWNWFTRTIKNNWIWVLTKELFTKQRILHLLFVFDATQHVAATLFPWGSAEIHLKIQLLRWLVKSSLGFLIISYALGGRISV